MNPTYHERNLANLDKLSPHTKEAALKWYDYCVRNGVNILIYETIRTLETQADNVKNGASETMKSYHLVGQALDFVPIVKGKEGWKSYNSEPFKTAIKYAKSLNFEWGGDWGWDQPHLQFKYKGYGTDKADVVKPNPQTKAEIVVGDIVPFPGKPLKTGSKGKDVERIQRALKVTVTGVFDGDTTRAVKEYQKRKGLVADGVVGKLTWSKLF